MIHPESLAYNAALRPLDKEICDVIAQQIDVGLPEAENTIWHAHPVWLMDGNPIVGYSKLKNCIRLLFWSGQSFEETGLQPEGKFKAAEVRYTAPDQIDLADLSRWLGKARLIQWDYKNIVRRRGRLERLPSQVAAGIGQQASQGGRIVAKKSEQQGAGVAGEKATGGLSAAYPSPSAWQGPISWKGSPLRAVEDYSRAIPRDAVFTRGEVVMTLSEAAGPGISRQSNRALPALIRLDAGKAAEVCMPGLDGRCWVLRPVRDGRQTRWRLFAGDTFESATEAIAAADGTTVERLNIQSILPLSGTGQVVALAIDDEGRSEKIPRKDPDPRD